MAALLILCVGLLSLLPAAGWCEDGFRDDFREVVGWEARPDWLGAPAARPVLQVGPEGARFGITEPDRGMKWKRDLEPVEVEQFPWLVVRYRAEGYAAGGVDYVVWLADGATDRDGLRVFTGDKLRSDGQWHVLAFNLLECGAVSPVTGLAVQCFATQAGNASLWMSQLALTDTPPAEAENVTAPAGEARVWEIPLQSAAAWTVQPGWLGNYDAGSAVTRTDRGLEFRAPEAARGAKWSCDLPQAVPHPAWVFMRYRARGLDGGSDYALYVASEPGGQARQEEYLIHLGDLAADGAWHVQVCPVRIPSVKTLAVQVQALADQASLEVAQLRFLDRKPTVRLADLFTCEPGWPAGLAPFRPLALPPGNLSGPDLAHKLGFPDWLEAGKVSVDGVPFELRAGDQAVLMTSVKDVGTVSVPLEGRAAELYLLLAAQLPATEEPSFGGGHLQSIRQVERFVARVEYADGSAEEQFPFSLTAGRHCVSRGLGAYALALDPARDLKRLVLCDGMTNGAFGLVAATLSDRPGPATAATAPAAALQLPPRRPAASQAPGITDDAGVLHVNAGTVSLDLDHARGLRVARAVNHSGVGAPLSIKPGPLFRVEGPGLKLTSEDFEATGVLKVLRLGAPAVELQTRCNRVAPPITVRVEVDLSSPGEIGLRARCDFGGRDRAGMHFIFPELSGLGFGGAAQDNWFWLPRRGHVISNVPLSLRETYAGGGSPLQIMGAFGPAQGTGLYMMTQDLTAAPRLYQVQKSEGTVRLAVEWWPCGSGELPRTVIGCNQGDWHQQLDRYREWVAEWYHPAAPRKAWFREVFNFRQQFMNFGIPVNSGMFDPKTQTFNFRQVVEADAQAFGGVDYLHLFDWGWDPVHGRCGDYAPWEYLGGADRFRRAVEELKAAGVPVGLYIEGYLVDPESNLGKAHGKEWQLLDPQAKPYTYFAPSYNMCPAVKAWQDYLSATYGRARAQTGAVGFYIDEYGFSNLEHLCYNPAHGHELPASPVLGEREMTRRVHEAVGPDCAVYTEESPTDVNSQFQDGSFTYNISSVPDEWSPTHVNLYRFAFPTFKTIEIITCDHPLGSNIEAVKRILFNGEAIWLEGVRDKWFTPQTRKAIARCHKVLRDNREAFAGDFPVPLIPTLRQGVYANQFDQRADGRGKTCWTVYNTGFRTVRGELLTVAHVSGARYVDGFTGQEVPARVEGGAATLSLTLGPRDVAVITRSVPADQS